MIAAIVPAAGQSHRMGRPKLILPIGGMTVIARVVGALLRGGADPVVVVAPPVDAPGAATLIAEAEKAGAIVVVAPAKTADMRASVELGLDRLAAGPIPRAVLLAPGDSPGLTAGLVARVIASARLEPGAIVVPARDGRRGHPLLLPWPLAGTIRRLPPGLGVNALLADHADAIVEIDGVHADALDDLDTPEDYRRCVETPPSPSTTDRPNRQT